MSRLEADLRVALRAHAARVHASRDLLEVDYHPRTPRMRPPVLVGAVLAAAAATVTALLSLASGAGSAFADWTAHPTTPARGQLAAAEAYCADRVPFPRLPLKLVDTRGPFTFAVYSDGSSNDFCTTGPSFRNASGWSTSSAVAVPAGQLFLWAEHTTTDSGQAYTFLIAKVGAGVSAAYLKLDDGRQVAATVDNGWGVAWWPGSSQLASAQLTTPAGARAQTFPLSGCGLHNCNGGPHGGENRGS